MRASMTSAVLLASLVTIGSRAHAGPGSGGGGGSFVCRSAAGQVLNSELLDLWESKNRPHHWEKSKPYRLNIPYTNENIVVQITRALDKLKPIDPLLYARIEKDLVYVKSHVEELPIGQSIALPADANPIYSKEGCPLEGMMYFDGETQNLSLKPEIFHKAVSPTVVAASWTHEAIYKTVRDTNGVENDSTWVRRLNACLYATDDCFGLKVVKPLPATAKVYNCESSDTKVEVIETSRVKHEEGPFPEIAYAYDLRASRLAGVEYKAPIDTHLDFSFYLSNGVPNGPSGSSYGGFSDALEGSTNLGIVSQTYGIDGGPEVQVDANFDLKLLKLGEMKIVATGALITPAALACTLVR